LTRARRIPLPIEVPPDATEVEVSGPRPFVTRVRYRAADGHPVDWSARRHRKSAESSRGLTWWIGLLFVIGSTCFLVGPIPAFEDAVGMPATDATFFIGSIFFTTASYLSYMQVVRAGGRRWAGWTPQLMGFWATFIQLVGTLFFNVTTLAALVSLTRPEAEQYVWRPDAFGSICFLVASAIAFAEAGHRWFSWRPGKRDWHITALNLWGSVFFGISAIGAYVDPDGDMVSAAWADGGTFLGAACFLVASILMMPEGRNPATDHD
jgi:hypothetical protein